MAGLTPAARVSECGVPLFKGFIGSPILSITIEALLDSFLPFLLLQEIPEDEAN